MSRFPTELPVDAILGEIRTTLRSANRIVIEAPPGAGKTTRVPPALMMEPWIGGGRILLLEPRRLAARAAADRMASEMGEAVGRTVGVTTRFDRRTSAETRIEVLTEGVLTRRLQTDPGLSGVAAIIFDEFHERGLQADLGLALAMEAQEALREDLRLVVMSATLDGVAVADLLGGAAIARAEGRMFPVETRYRPPPAARGRQPDPVAFLPDVICEALATDEGSILAFLPGQGEIHRVVSRLSERAPGPDIDILPLYADLSPAHQKAALAPSPPGRRKVVLATTIAETSLTIDGVRVVIDTGLKRAPRLDPAVGLSRLITVGISRASADQRRGRAGRTSPGVCYRLWAEAAHGALPAFDRPEILDADLAGLVLDLACWGVTDPASLAWLDAPPPTALRAARELLVRLRALDSDGKATPDGRAMALAPLHPRLAHMVLTAQAGGERRLALMLAGLLEERDLSSISGTDLVTRVRLLSGVGTAAERGKLADSDRGVWDRVTRLADRMGRNPAVNAGLGGPGRGGHSGKGEGSDLPIARTGLLVARAYPDRIAKRRRDDGADYVLANGRGAVLDTGDPLAASAFLAVADMSGDRAKGRIRRAAGIDMSIIEDEFGDRITEEVEVRWDDARGQLVARDVRRLDVLVLEEKGRPVPSDDRAVDAMIAMIRDKGIRRLPWTEAARRLQSRIAFARSNGPKQSDFEGQSNRAGLSDVPKPWPDISDEALTGSLEVWIGPMLAGIVSLGDLARIDLLALLEGYIGWEAMRDLDRQFPDAIEVPSGRRLPVDYGADGGPVLSVRLQEMFGCDRSPTLGDGRVAVTVALLSPAGRPLQVTRDLAGFWRGSYAEVRREMRGRYLKHDWPEDPTVAVASSHGRKPRQDK